MASVKEMWSRADQISRTTRKLLATALLTAIATGMTVQARGQTFAEWFQQKKTQKKYLLEQIIALQTYGGYLSKGYQIAQQGTGAISGYLEKEFTGHSGFYARKKIFNEAFHDNPQVAEIIRWEKAIVQETDKLRTAAGFTKDERYYLGQVSKAVLSDCTHQAEVLEQACSNGAVTMSDEERLQLIGRVHEDMAANVRFTASFVKQAILYASRKERALSSTPK